jgi:hypothetical protein
MLATMSMRWKAPWAPSQTVTELRLELLRDSRSDDACAALGSWHTYGEHRVGGCSCGEYCAPHRCGDWQALQQAA